MLLMLNRATGHTQVIEPTPPCCCRKVFEALIDAGYEPHNPNAKAYAKRINLQVVNKDHHP